MRPDSDRWVTVTPSQFPHEREGLDHVREGLPDRAPYRAWSNLELITDEGRNLEVDLLVVGPAGIYLIELKSHAARIFGNRHRWKLEGERGRVGSMRNPWKKTDYKAKVLSSLLADEQRKLYSGRKKKITKDRELPFAQAAIFLTSPAVRCDLTEVEKTHLFGLEGKGGQTRLDGIVSGLLMREPTGDRAAVDERMSLEIAALLERSGIGQRHRRRVADYELDHGVYDEGEDWQDFLGTHLALRRERVRVRIYHVGRATLPERRAVLEQAAEREYRLLRHVSYPGLVGPTYYSGTHMGPALVYPHDPDAKRLDHLLAEDGDRLGLEERLAIVRSVAETVRYAHSRHIVHRGLSPRSVLVRLRERKAPRVQVADWQTLARTEGGSTSSQSRSPAATVLASTRHMSHLLDPTMEVYRAPEVLVRGDADPVRADVFSLGALTYLALTGQPPASDRIELEQLVQGGGGLDLAGQLELVTEELRGLVLDATRGDATARLRDADAFLELLGEAERTSLAPEPEAEPDPFKAQVGDVIGGRWRLKRRLGSGATAVALLVEDLNEDCELRVLKVAGDDGKVSRLVAEAEVLRGLDDGQRVALLAHPEPVELRADGATRTALVLEYAGGETLAKLLREQGRLGLDRLERYGDDLLDIAGYLDANGVDHRDIKPDNLGIRERRGDHTKHLVLFDFSLARTPASDIMAGTPPYLDPFLGQGSRQRWDGSAERYAVAVTLFEMATGQHPTYGDGQSKASMVQDPAMVTPSMFEAAVAERLTMFFAKALHREARERHSTVEEMHRAWRAVFEGIDLAAASARSLSRRTPVAEAGLSARALSALEQHGVTTVGQLLDLPGGAITAWRNVNNPTKQELNRRVKELRDRLKEPAQVVEVRGIDALVDQLIPEATPWSDTRTRYARLFLGRSVTDGGEPPPAWPSQGELARLLGVSQTAASQAQKWLREQWLGGGEAGPLAGVCDELAELISAAGGVLTAEQVAEALLALRGSVAEEPVRTRQALGLVRAAVEVEQARGGDARFIPRLHRGVTLLALEPSPGAAGPTAAELLDYGVALARVTRAVVPSGQGGGSASQTGGPAQVAPIPAARALERLRAIAPPEGMPDLDDGPLLRLAAAASGTAAVSSRNELYPRGLDAGTALRHAGTALAGGATISVQALRDRVRVRFPAANALPDRPLLDELLTRAGSKLVWDSARNAYHVPEPRTGSQLPTWKPTEFQTVPPTRGIAWLDGSAADEIDRRLRISLAERSFLAIGVEPLQFDRAERALTERYGVEPLNVTAVLLRRLREELAGIKGLTWDDVLAADAAEPGSTAALGLQRLVARAVGAVEAAVKAPAKPQLLMHAAPLARYGQQELLDHLADHAVARPAAVWLLLPDCGDGDRPRLDSVPVPLLSPAQWLRVPTPWLLGNLAPVRGGTPR